MIARFCLYSVLKNLRFADPFLAIYLIELGFSYTEIGALLGFEKLVTALLEIPSGVAADRWGRRRILAISFACHAIGLSVLALGSASAEPNVFWFLLGLGIYGMGEAFRTGSHKAIILDYLDYHDRGKESTAVLSLARTFSKVSSALAGCCAGGLLFWLQDYGALFWLSAAAAAAGCLLILTYPKYLEGESQRDKQTSDTASTVDTSLGSLMRNARMWPMMVQSLIYESQVEVVLKLFLQPFLHLSLGAVGLPLTSAGSESAKHAPGSLVVGANELFRDGLGAVGANNSARVERRLTSRTGGLVVIYLLTTATLVVMTLAPVYPSKLLLLGLAAVGLLTLLQNIRRPMFVSELNEVANKPLRATVLSIESQARSFLVALQMPLMGMAADAWGLWTVCAIAAVLMLFGLPSLKRPSAPSPLPE